MGRLQGKVRANRTRKGEKVRNGNLIRYVLRKNLAAAVISTAVSTVNTLVDSYLMGNLLGPDALSAINLCMPLNYAIIAIQCLLAAGASLLASKKIGERKQVEADRIFTVSMISILVIGTMLMILSGRIAAFAQGILCSQEKLAAPCREYGRMLVLCALPIMLQMGMSNFVSRSGNPKIVMQANLASLVVNIAMDVVYVKVLNFGIGGSALATGTSALVTCAILAAYMVKAKPFRFRAPGKDGMKMFLGNIGAGSAETMQTIAITVLTFSLNFFIQRTEGVDGVFVLSVGVNFMSVALLFVMGVQSVYISVGTMMRGQGDETGLKMLFRTAVRTALPITCILVLVQLLIPEQLAGLFGAETQEQFTVAGYGLRIMAVYSIPLAFLMMMVSNYMVLGYFALATGTIASMLGTLPLCLMLFRAAFPANCIWYAMPASAMITILLSAAASEIFRRKQPGLRPITLMPKAPNEKKIFESSVTLRAQGRESYREFTDRMLPFFEELNIDRISSSRIRLCIEEMLDYMISQAQKDRDTADVRIAATEEEINVMIRDNLPPYNPLSGEDFNTSRKILQAFCPDMEYKNAFQQNTITMNWKTKK